MSLLLQLPAPIGPPFKSDEPAVHGESVEDRRGGDCVEHLSPLRGREVRRDDGRPEFCPLRDDLEEDVGLLLRRHHVSELIEAEHGDPHAVVDEAIDAFGAGELRHEIEEAREDGLMPLGEGVVTEGCRDVGRSQWGQVLQ